MRSQLSLGGVYFAALLLATVGVACGTPATHATLHGEAIDASMLADDDGDDADDADDDAGDDEDEDEDGDEGDNQADCDELKQKMQMDGFAMQMTEEFQEMSQTAEYRRLESTMMKMQSKGCSFGGKKQSATCNKLRQQAMKQQRDLMRTEEFTALSKTKEFKQFMRDAQEAMENGCLDDMGMNLDPAEMSYHVLSAVAA